MLKLRLRYLKIPLRMNELRKEYRNDFAEANAEDNVYTIRVSDSSKIFIKGLFSKICKQNREFLNIYIYIILIYIYIYFILYLYIYIYIYIYI